MDQNFQILENQYQISKQKIGEGGFGTVFKGKDILNKNDIACKVVSIKKLEKIPKLQQLFAQEVTLQQSIESPFIVQLHKVYRSEDFYYLILEYCEGGDLQQYINSKGPIPEQQAIGFLLQILAGLRQLHKKSIIHRDLKPANILIKGNILKITDFGAARTIQQDDSAKTQIGTPKFLAPEILDEKEYGFEADIFSLGVLLYQVLFKDYPFQGQSVPVIYQNMKKQDIDFQKNNVFISPLMIDFLIKLLKFDREKRITWSEIYNHPIVAMNLNNYKQSPQIVPSQADIKMYQDPKFSYKKLLLQNPNKVNPYMEEQIPQLAQKSEEKAKEIFEAMKKYVHKKNVYSILKVLVESCQKLNKLQINYQIPQFLVCKKMKTLNNQILKSMKEKVNLFNIDCFQEFKNSNYYQNLVDMFQGDLDETEKNFKTKQQEALESMKRLGINNPGLQNEINTYELSPNFLEFYSGSLMSYGDGLKKYLNQTQDPELRLILFYHIVIVYEGICIDKEDLTTNYNFDFEKYKQELLQTPPQKYNEIIEQKFLKIFS